MDSEEENLVIIIVPVVVGILILLSFVCCYIVIKRKHNLKCLSCFSKHDPEIDININVRDSNTVSSSLSCPRNDQGESCNSGASTSESNLVTLASQTTSHVENETRHGPTIKPLSIANRSGISLPQKINHFGKDTPVPTATATSSSQIRESKSAIVAPAYKDVRKLSENEWPSLPMPATSSAKSQQPRSNPPLAPVQSKVIGSKVATKTDTSANLVFKLDNEKKINGMILLKQLFLRDDKNQSETAQQVQHLILKCTADVEDLVSEGCSLIIGVDATPATQAGYCVNLKEKSLQYYVIKRDDLPWVIHNSKNPSEFEMKNFMFALTVWKEEILKWKRVRIYTDNFAFTKHSKYYDKKYGNRAFEVLSHFTKCEGVHVLNMHDMAINRFENLKKFAMYIQPADDLSRWRIGLAIDFLTKLYGIGRGNVKGTHCVDSSGHYSSASKIWYSPTSRYEEVLRHAMNTIEGHKCSNPSCSTITKTNGRGVAGLHQNVLQASIRIRRKKPVKRNRQNRSRRLNALTKFQQTTKY